MPLPLSDAELFTHAFHDAAIGMALVGLDGRWLRVNRALCEIVGYSEPELLARTFQDITFAEDLDADLGHAADLLEGRRRSYEMEKRYVHKDGRLVWVLLHGAIIRGDDGTPRAFVAQVKDISQRKAADYALRLSEERLDLALKGTRAGLWDWHVQTGKTTFNDRWAEIVGYTLEELAPISIQTWMSLAHPDDLARSNEALQAHFEGRADYYDCEARMRHKDGHWVWVQDRGRVVEWDGDGRPVRMLGTHLDITARKAHDAERERLITDLESALAEVKTLRGILPICSYCKRVRDDRNYWQAVEAYVSAHSQAQFSHGICPECFTTHVASIMPPAGPQE